MPSYQVTLSEGGSPNCAGVYEEHIEYNGKMSYTCTNEVGTWYLYYTNFFGWYISPVLGATGSPAFKTYWRGLTIPGDLEPGIGGEYSGTATVAEYVPPADDTPDDFSFLAVVDADPETQYVSDPAEVTGMDAGTAISVANGEYRINGGAWTSDAGTIDPGDTLELRATSSADQETEITVAVTVGTLTVEWSITTAAAQTLKQHLIVSRDGIIQPVGACVIVPGWV